MNISLLSRGRQLRGNTPLRATAAPADAQQSNNLPQKQSVDSPQQDLSPVGSAVSAQPRADILQLRAQDVPAESEGDLTQRGGRGSGKTLKPSLRAKEQSLKARLLHMTESKQQTQTHIQV